MGESPNLVHQKGDPYRTKGSATNILLDRDFSRFCSGANRVHFWPQNWLRAARFSPCRQVTPLVVEGLNGAIKRAAVAACRLTVGPINSDRPAYIRELDAGSDRAPRSRVPSDPNPDAAAQAT